MTVTWDLGFRYDIMAWQSVVHASAHHAPDALMGSSDDKLYSVRVHDRYECAGMSRDDWLRMLTEQVNELLDGKGAPHDSLMPFIATGDKK